MFSVQILFSTSRAFVSAYYTIGSETIRVRSVVVVDVAARVDIPNIVGVAAISTAQTNVLRITYVPYR